MTAREKRLYARIWDALAEPRNVTLLTCLGYALALAVGLDVIIEDTASEWRDAIAWALVAGGGVGLAGCPFGQWKIERGGLIALFFASLGRLIVIANLNVYDRSLAFFYTVLGIVFILTRWIRISKSPVDPARVALQMERGDPSCPTGQFLRQARQEGRPWTGVQSQRY